MAARRLCLTKTNAKSHTVAKKLAWHKNGTRSTQNKVIYNIGTKFLFLECFGHNSTWFAPFSKIIDDSGSSRRALSNPHVKTRLGAI